MVISTDVAAVAVAVLVYTSLVFFVDGAGVGE